MMRFEPGDIVHAPFPHVERAVVVRRPALLLCAFETDDAAIGTLAWVLMITSAQRSRWRGDVNIPDAETLGLVIPSRVRTAKVATLVASDMVRIGRMDERVWMEVRAIVSDALGPN